MGVHLSCLHKRRAAAAGLKKTANGGRRHSGESSTYVIAEYLVDFSDCKVHQNCLLAGAFARGGQNGAAEKRGSSWAHQHGVGNGGGLQCRPRDNGWTPANTQRSQEISGHRCYPQKSPPPAFSVIGPCPIHGMQTPLRRQQRQCPRASPQRVSFQEQQQPRHHQDGVVRRRHDGKDVGHGRQRLGNIPAPPAASRGFATVAHRLSLSFDERRLPTFPTRIPPNASIPLEASGLTPPPTPPPPPLTSTPLLQASNPGPSDARGSLTSIVNFLHRTNSTESQFKLTVRKGRESCSRSSGRKGPKVSLRPAITHAAGKTIEVIDSRPAVEYRPRYSCLRRSLVEGLERLDLFAAEESAETAEQLSRSRPSVRCGGDSEPRAHSEPGPSVSEQRQALGETASGAAARRRCQTVSRDAPPKSPATLRKDPKQRTFYFFHIRTSSLDQTESFLFDSLVLCLARRYSCTLRLVPIGESLDLPDGLRRVEVAGPNFRDIRRFLHHLTTSDDTLALHQQVQERFTLTRQLRNCDSVFITTSNGQLQASLV